jgi:uncharacterized protein (DUF2267 family)
MRREEFLERVGKQGEVGPQEAEARIRAVFSVLDEAVSGGEIRDIRRQFSSEFDHLFG